METLLLYRQLQDQLSQWVQPKDQRHLQGFAEIVAAILQSGEAYLGRWIPYLSHRDCQARAPMGRLSYFLHSVTLLQADTPAGAVGLCWRSHSPDHGHQHAVGSILSD